jgi:hypothetical protein
MTDQAVVRDAAFAATLWRARGPELRALVERYPDAALAGVVEAITRDASNLPFLLMVVDAFPLEALERGSVPEPALLHKRLLLEQAVQAERVDESPRAQAAVAEDQGDAGAAAADAATPRQVPTLSELLSRDRKGWDEVIAHGAQLFASEVASLAPNEKDDLKDRLDEWWPDKPYRETITRKGPNQWSQENLAAAWLWFGPPLDKSVEPRQWAELASCGVLFDDQTSWLRRHANTEAVLELVDICQATDSRTWHEALAATPDPLPAELVEAVVGNLRSSEEDYQLEHIGSRLLAAAGATPLHTLSDVSEEFARALRPLLAVAGELDAQRELLRDVRNQLEAHQRPSGRELGWLEGVSSEELLDDLFACVALLYGPAPAVKETSSWFTVDVVTPVMNAIRNIGGRAVVERYDALIARGEGLQFLVDQREAVAQAMLLRHGLVAAEQAADGLGLPTCAPPDS